MKERYRFKKDRMKKGIYVLPNLFTTASLFSGFYSVIASMKGLYEIAAWTILIAIVLRWPGWKDCPDDAHHQQIRRRI